MSSVFLKIVNMSIIASWLILAVVLVRLLLRKAPKWVSCLLWGLVAIRLVCPFSFESIFSLIPSSETIPANIALQQAPAINSGITVVNEFINPVIAESFTPNPEASANPLRIIVPVVAIVWVSGIVIMLAYALIIYMNLKKKVSVCMPVGERTLSCDEVNAPFILGVFRPVIYVPSSMTGETFDLVVRHETAHLQRHDHWWKPLGYLLLAIHWFNPLCWLAYILLCRDIEMACDEKVIRNMDKGDIAAYSQALLDCSVSRRRIAACPLAFGEVGVKARIKGVLNYKKPAFWVILVAIAACVVLAICFLTSPVSKDTVTSINHGTGVQGTSDNPAPYDFRPMLMVGGVIFMDTGKELSVEIDPSAILGEITSSVTGDKRPTEDGQSNFECVGSQYAYYEDGLVVLINNEWYLFERDDSSFSIVGGGDNPGSGTIDIRRDVCDLYLQVLEDLWSVDSGLNGGISKIGLDFSELSHLTESEKETVMQEFASKHSLPYVVGTWDELCEQGYIDREKLHWEDGLFFSIKTNEEAVWYLPFIKYGDSEPELTAFDAQKWRSGLGAYYFFQCTAQKNADGKWTYTVGMEAIS